MKILTQPGIIKTGLTSNISETIDWLGNEYCIAYVPDGFNLNEKEMKIIGVDFWWELCPGYFDPILYDEDIFNDRGLIVGVYETYNVSKEKNIAMAIYEITRFLNQDPIEYWNKTLPR